MKITSEITRHIAFMGSQEILAWIGKQMALCEKKTTPEEAVRWNALRDCLDFVERWRYDAEFEVSETTETKIVKVEATK